MSVQTEILNPALRQARVVGAAGRGANDSQLAEAFQALNRMIDGWIIQRLVIYTIRADRYSLATSQTSYTIGPTGADFTGPRPTRITAANIVLTGSSPEVRVPLHLMTDEEWESLRVREIPTTLPSQLFNDGAFPNSRLYLWGYPTEANDLELFTWNQLTQYAAKTDPVFLPPGYVGAIVPCLAKKLCTLFGTPVTPDLEAEAREAFGKLKGNNSKAPRILNDAVRAQGREFNYRTGNF